MTQLVADEAAAVGGDPVELTTDAPEAVVGNTAEVDTDQGEEDEFNAYPDDAPREDAEDGEQNEEGEDDEPATPAIEAPASLNADEKARFAQLQPEAQRMLADVEQRRNAQVTAATTKAANAQREAEQRAAMADAQAKAVYSQQLRTFAEALAPQMPDPQLAQTDPGQYVARKAQYDAARAQHDQFVQQVEALEAEANTDVDQAFVAGRDRELMAIPEVQNEETREGFFTKALKTAETLGLDMSQLKHATAAELKALRTIHDDQEDARKWREHRAAQDAARRHPNGQFKPTRQLPPVTMKPGTTSARGNASADPVKMLYPND